MSYADPCTRTAQGSTQNDSGRFPVVTTKIQVGVTCRTVAGSHRLVAMSRNCQEARASGRERMVGKRARTGGLAREAHGMAW